MCADHEQHEFFATCPRGFEQLLASELAGLGASRIRPLQGQVAFWSNVEGGCRACLWSGLASRIALVLARIDAGSSDELYEGLSGIPWEDHVPPSARLAVDAHGTNQGLRDTRFTALRTKDAISDRLLAVRGARPVTNADRPSLTILTRISGTRATIAVDFSGEPLFKRGYAPARTGGAPLGMLRPDYAAALLWLGGWPGPGADARGDGSPAPTLAVLFPGTGTILAEAASMALDLAPGRLRTRWGFEGWLGHSPDAWSAVQDEARRRAGAAHGRAPVLLAVDPRGQAQRACRQTLRSAGLDCLPTFGSVEFVASGLRGAENPLAVADLSWIAGDDLATCARALTEVELACAGMAGGTGRIVSLSSGPLMDRALGAKPETTIHTLVGRDEAELSRYGAGALPLARPMVEIPAPDGVPERLPVLVESTGQFARRLRKVWRTRRKWARREDVSCFRIYDADLPDYAVTIDLFEGVVQKGPRETPAKWLQIYEYAAPREIDPGLARARLLDVLAVAPRLLDVSPKNTFVHVREHGRGGSQYAGAPQKGGRRPNGGICLVEEGGLLFEVSFERRLDCGLFLDQRDTRALVREMMKAVPQPKRFLNLFAYTGSATCYAADGGALLTTTVDMSRPTLDWARRNMERNGFVSQEGGPTHEFVQADVIRWVREQRHGNRRWDLVFCDVPTFSNSNRMRRSWDVQRDHVELLICVSRLLSREGRAIFSCNLRSFRPDVDALRRAGVELEDITSKTIPGDFSRSPRVHHCYVLRRC